MFKLFKSTSGHLLFSAALLSVLLLPCVGCDSGGAHRLSSQDNGEIGKPTMVFYNAPPTIDHFKFPDSDHAQGEMIAWHADLDDAEGASANRVGHCNGTMMVTRRNEGRGDDREHRMTTIELDWDGGADSLLVAGSHPYKHGATESDTPIVRAITGGTGKYMFACGQVISTRLPSGWYRHDIWLKD